MPVDPALIDRAASNVTWLCVVWAMIASDGTEARYAAHTRDITFDSESYLAAPVEPTRFSEILNVLEPNHLELFGVLDDIVTEEDIQGGKWKNAELRVYYIDYLQPNLGWLKTFKGQAGKIPINNGTFRVEFRSLADKLSQEIGDVTSPNDRNRRPEDLGVSMGSFTFSRTVTAVVDRRNFTVNGTAQINDFFAFGRAEWTGGDNDGLEMEVKANVGNVIELQLPMRSVIQVGDTVDLIAGYDGSREQARDKFGAMENFDGEPDLPGLRTVLRYPD